MEKVLGSNPTSVDYFFTGAPAGKPPPKNPGPGVRRIFNKELRAESEDLNRNSDTKIELREVVSGSQLDFVEPKPVGYGRGQFPQRIYVRFTP